MDAVLQHRQRWTFPQIDALRKRAGMTWDELADEVGLKKRYLLVNIKRKYKPNEKGVGGRGAIGLNALVDRLRATEPRVAEKITQTPEFGALDHMYTELRDILRDAISGEAISVMMTGDGKGRFVVRRPFTKCPRCTHTEEETFAFTSVKSAYDARDRVMAWLGQ